MIYKIEAESRKTGKKSDLNKLRDSGLIPAVVYGPQTKSTKITLNKADFLKLYKKSFNELAFFDIQLKGKNYHSIIKEKQIHPVSREILHLDFMVIPAHQKIEIDIPIKFKGTPVGVKEGGILDIIQRTVKIYCNADNLPEDIELDISKLNIDQAYHVDHLKKGEWEYRDPINNTLVVIHPKKVEPVVVEVEEEAEAAEEEKREETEKE